MRSAKLAGARAVLVDQLKNQARAAPVLGRPFLGASTHPEAVKVSIAAMVKAARA